MSREGWRKWYSTREWWKLRSAQLKAKPHCRFCAQAGVFTAAEVVDHVKAHRGDRALFFDPANLQSLCRPCHDRIKQGIETRGYDSRLGPDGLPIDPNHPFNR